MFNFIVILILASRIIHGQASSCSCDIPKPNFATDVNFLYYKCDNESRTPISFPIRSPEGLMNVLEDKRTIFYISGYRQTPYDESVKIVPTALCHGQTDNVVLLDWSQYSRGIYFFVFDDAEKVGSLFAYSLKRLVDAGLNVSNIYIIGYSLGSVIAGYAGKCNNFTIPRITGLDPANMIFYPSECYLSRNDAAWIDVIHTDMGGWGTSASLGTAEYYANSGKRVQPGCPKIAFIGTKKDICSHQRSVEIYVATKYEQDKYIAVECDSFSNYELNKCANNVRTGVGYGASNLPGHFYFPYKPE